MTSRAWVRCGTCTLLSLPLLAAAAGCHRQPGAGSLGCVSVQVGERSVLTLHQYGERIALAVWTDGGEPGRAYHTDDPLGYTGGRVLWDVRRFAWVCATEDGVHGSVRFFLGGGP